MDVIERLTLEAAQADRSPSSDDGDRRGYPLSMTREEAIRPPTVTPRDDPFSPIERAVRFAGGGG
jgi:hypothetical protein